MKDSEDFDAFVAIVDAGSISEAARALGVPRASLSRQLGRLEERLGVRLLNRTTRSLVTTRAGDALYSRARSLVEAARAAVTAVQRLDDVPRGLLRVSSAPLNSQFLGALVSEFIGANPDVEVELRTTTQHVDLSAEQIDVALRGGIVRDPGLIARRLFRSDMLAVAAPKYLEMRGVPMHPADLARHVCLRGFVEGARPAAAWPLLDGGKIAVDGPLVTNDLKALLGAATSGLGIALLPRQLVETELACGLLVPVLEGRVGVEVSLSLVWLEREFVDPKVRAFVDLAVAWAAEGRWARPMA
jgi:DNA-binding transcriptional LysR family regulator